ncbi:branched-chain amino acid ABC transporter substrate-binding protein [Amycolatopsis keratiniphila]|uniref:branched-chain amino acid ABC transporter substrate-binding protein n=1 Tax=Amycolatopsis keratiniphila TaxID=129921 RepID=UPI000907C54F|nr:branched-chain amino acid ABC transporter substrate-binding protein [Amycolatopsis keratiniphila]OLZ57892.1 branched chain amino acid ABC transporter substrate-binding protein [Amycolatopsis keratiniphila subsp. nogabecina]
MRFGRVFAVAAAASLALAGCAGGSSSSGGGDSSTLKIGFMGDLTGENSGIVIPPRNGAKLAIDEYNKTNPAIKLELKEYDSQGKPEQATSLIAAAVGQDKISALIGPAFSGESKAIGGQLEQSKIPSVSPSATNAGLSSNGWKYWHRVVASDASQGPAIANFLITAKSPKKAYIISDDQEYSVGLADNFEKTLKEKNVPTERDKFAKDASDYSSTVQKVKAANPDIILFGGYYAQGGRLLKQLRDGGVTATFATGDGSLDAQLISGAGAAAAEKAVVGCPCNIPDAGSTDEFSTKYKAAFNVDPAIYSSEGYDAATAIINAVKSGANTPEKINEALKTVDFKGASKQIKFKENGEPSTEAINIYQVTGGVLKNLGVSTEAKLNG